MKCLEIINMNELFVWKRSALWRKEGFWKKS
ncbi:hypothetical protein IIC_01587 [Bacillus cereus VD021]|uniref:Uncharacterized protein n=3 Tax=Bacillus cereus group TaxID=86661 RepID=R8D6L9_BACCE|nr:hypothetical protein IC3_00509 [Bacillus cereus VD142]EOO19377.1 hypothetical protein IGA_02117 [Bacillus cereus HuA3-9]EOO76272.1 hypothetical protein IIC_01587 [Bacillus cereus VD021]REF32763.1 hypothetical protein DET55_117121 [Bacillus mycoides]